MGRPLPMASAPRTVTVTKRVRATAKRGTGINTPLTPLNTVIAMRERTEADCVNKDNWAGKDETRPDETTAYSWNMTGIQANVKTMVENQTMRPVQPKNPAPKTARVKKNKSSTRRVDRDDLHFSAVVRYSEVVKRSLWPHRTLRQDVPKRYRADVAKLCGLQA
ncbi:hypothetical protein BH765_gp99 [Gordonia phage Kvothe]|uniref:Uncharacterized protein n=1 Tax=Gordonia phage Kvothe TaxID=1838071 RepID=A0A160DEC2_9CAUD|nr:hypothetical protein BH765_gp99 [Gordonia phage Kvothe]ANA86161.1 hypothetical protein PBI_KVOTHE_99 [Gordonia phage Kvothe]